MNSKAVFRLLFHGFITVLYYCALVRFQSIPPIHRNPHEQFGGRFKFLTYWNLVAHFLFFTLSFIMDFMKPSSSIHSKLVRIRDKFYAGVVLPYGVFVVTMFWVLYAINRELIFPKVLDEFFPAWLNHVSHTVILPAILVETYILKHRHPRKKEGVQITMAFGLTYGLWVLFLGLNMDIWVYPVLQILNWTQRAVFLLGSLVFMALLYFAGERINCCFWGDNVVQKGK